MRDTELLRGLLRVEDPWDVTESKLDLERGRVDVRLEWRGRGRCPSCSFECGKHDHRERVFFDATSICAAINYPFMRWFPASTVPSMGC